MYSVPAREETYGDTERIIGTWFKKTGRREEVVLASKIAGPNPNLPICARRMTSRRQV
jgi:aryl-alcohol dehydrogenase-like predicted oxidoreductase